MDMMNKTFSQLADMIAERLPELANEISDLDGKCGDAREVLDAAEKSYNAQPNDNALGSALDEAEDKYWELQNKLDELNHEETQLLELSYSLKYISDCKDLLDVAAILVRN